MGQGFIAYKDGDWASAKVTKLRRSQRDANDKFPQKNAHASSIVQLSTRLCDRVGG
jgi:hypothetical protein